MSPSRSAAIARNEFRVLRRDPAPLLILIAMPLLMTPLYRGAFRAALVLGGHPHASGDDFAIPAQLVMFGFFLAPYTGFSFFRDHQWGTWNRLRATRATPTEIAAGKAIPMVLVGAAQATALLALGATALDLHTHGHLAALIALGVVYVIVAVAVGVALAATLRTVEQLNAFGFLGATLAGAIGGALVPLTTLPAWVRRLAPITPQYWTMRGMTAIVISGHAGASVAQPIALLALFVAACIMAAGLGLRRGRDAR